MYFEAKKLHLIEDLLKIKSEAALLEIETVVKKSLKAKKSKNSSARDFLGLISEEDSRLMESAIEEGCEQVNPDDWR